MRKALVWVAALAFVAGAAHATPYQYVGGANGAWGTNTNWNPVGVPGSGDCALLNWGGNVIMSGTITVGELIVENGTGMGNSGWGGSYNLIVTDSGGSTSGDLIYKSTADSQINHSGMLFNWDVYGHMVFDGSGAKKWNFPAGQTNKLILRGTNKAYKDKSLGSATDWDVMEIHGSYYDNGSTLYYQASTTVDVQAAGQILARPDGVASTWLGRRFIFRGGQSNLPAIGSNVDFRYMCTRTDNGAGKLVVAGGVTYPQDLYVRQNYWGAGTAITPYLWRITGGELKVNRDLFVGDTGGQADAPQGIWLTTEDNVTSASNKLTVNQDLVVQNTSYLNEQYGLRLNASEVRVGRHLRFNQAGTADLGSATIRLGGDFLVTSLTTWAQNNWTAGTSALICDGNGLTNVVQTIRTSGMPLHTLKVDTDCTVQLFNGADGDLRLTGHLIIDCGLFNDNDRPITFNGPEHQLKAPAANLAGGSLDDVILDNDAVVRLFSNVVMDNIEMGVRSKLYLNGFTLMVEGNTFISDQVSVLGEAYTDFGSNGTIYGTLPIPEPATLLLLGTGALGVLGYVRRRRMR